MKKEESVIDVEFKDEESGKVMDRKQIKNDIFINATDKYGFFRKRYLKFMERIINGLMSHVDKHLIHRVRFKLIHKYVKHFIVHKGLRLCDWIIGKHMIKTVEDIPAQAHNNHQRIWLDAWFKSLDDLWGRLLWNQGRCNVSKDKTEAFLKEFPTPEHYIKYKQKKNQPSHKGRKLIGQLYMTEVMEDTADRTMNDCFMLRVTRTMNEFYGVNPEEREKIPKPDKFPVFVSDTEKNKKFFLAFAQIPVWYPSDSKEVKIRDLERENHELKLKLEELNPKKETKKDEVKKDES